MDVLELTRSAEHALGRVLGRGVELEPEWVAPHQQASVLFRVRVTRADSSLPDTLIVKAADPSFVGDARGMLFNEWAALELLSTLDLQPPLSARLFAGDREVPLVVMEDLGTAEGSPLDLAFKNDPDAAEQSLLEYAGTLGRLHAVTSGRSTDFYRRRDSMEPRSPPNPLYHDPWSDAGPRTPQEVEQAIDAFREALAKVGVQPASGCDDEIRGVTPLVEGYSGPLLALCQGDQNGLDSCFRVGRGLRLLDFGVAGYRHALLEGMPHRMTWGCFRRVPRSVFARFERVYQRELATAWPQIADERVFHRAMADAGARWNVFHVVSRLPDAVRRDRPRGGATLRQQVIAGIDAFADLSEETNAWRALGTTARTLGTRLRQLWSAHTHDIPYFPAFEQRA